MNKYSWNFDESAELWGNDTFDTIEECIKEAEAENTLDGNQYNCVFIGENIPFVPTVDAERVLDDIQEQAYNECGEIGGDWEAYDYKKKHELEELGEKLSAIVIEWLEKYRYAPNMYSIEGIRRYSFGSGADR